MKLIDFIFQLLFKFAPIDSIEYGKLKEEAFNWYNDINIDSPEVNPIMKRVKKFSEMWYAKVLYALLFVIGVRQVQIYMNPNLQPLDDDDDDD
jgi:hypothetical protein